MWGGIAFPTIAILSHILSGVITNYQCDESFHDLSQSFSIMMLLSPFLHDLPN